LEIFQKTDHGCNPHQALILGGYVRIKLPWL